MIIRINGVPLADNQGEELPFVLTPMSRGIQKAIPAAALIAATAFVVLAPDIALASDFGTTTDTGGWRIIHLLQKGAFWVGLAVSIWGVYEWQVGGPGWKDRILKGFLGYVLIMLLPMLFLAVKEAFH